MLGDAIPGRAMPIPLPLPRPRCAVLHQLRLEGLGGLLRGFPLRRDTPFRVLGVPRSVCDHRHHASIQIRGSGKDAARLLSRMAVRGFAKMQVGRVAYTCWCDANGKVIDDGTISRLGEDHFFVTAAEPTLSWMSRLSRGFDVEIVDVSEQTGALSLQGPTSRDILKQCSDTDMDRLKFFQTTSARLDGVEVQISRTGYSGDLGYELWCDARNSLKVWDAIMAAGRDYGIEPAGIEALDMVRIEAGLIMLGVDYYSCAARHHRCFGARHPTRSGSTRCVKLDRGAFHGTGCAASGGYARRAMEDGRIGSGLARTREALRKL